MSAFSKLFSGSNNQVREAQGLYQQAADRGLSGFGGALAGQRRAYSTLRAGNAAARQSLLEGRGRALDISEMGADNGRTARDVDAAYRRMVLSLAPQHAMASVAGRERVANTAQALGQFGVQSAQDQGRLEASILNEDPAAWFDALLGIVGTAVGTYYGGPAGGAAGYKLGSSIGGG